MIDPGYPGLTTGATPDAETAPGGTPAMGRYDPPPYDPDDLPDHPDGTPKGWGGHPQDDRAPLEGEIVFIEHPHRAYRRNTAGQTDYDQAFVREVVAWSIANPTWGLRRIGDKFGISKTTVANWCRSANIDRQKADVAQARAEASLQLQTARDQAWKMYELAILTRKPRYALDALSLINTITGQDARLMGLNMPTRVDVQVTELTEAELELQEIIREAQAKTAADEADVIAAASEDPDL
jgi:hypothetical protein